LHFVIALKYFHKQRSLPTPDSWKRKETPVQNGIESDKSQFSRRNRAQIVQLTKMKKERKKGKETIGEKNHGE
jgi:hypothetical protein